MLSRSTPHWLYYGNPYDFTKIDETQTYSEYFVNVKGPDDEWELLGETQLVKVCVLNGVAIRCRSYSKIPGRKVEGLGVATIGRRNRLYPPDESDEDMGENDEN